MSDREFMIIGKLVLTFGCLLGLPLWELWKLRRLGSDPVEEATETEAMRAEKGGQINSEHR